MKFRLLVIFMALPFLLSAQTKKHRKKAAAKHASAAVCKAPLQDYFTRFQLCPDSAETPYLYYKVYDWLGTLYKYAGETKKGIDCSGFVTRMYEEAYCISLSGGSRDIFTTVKPVDRCDLKEGDMVFFKIKKGQISHVGIYLGNNKFAHASVQSGVIISEVADGSVADRLGFQRGDRIVKINGTAVDTTKRLRTLASAQPNVWQVTIERGGKMLTRQFSG